MSHALRTPASPKSSRIEAWIDLVGSSGVTPQPLQAAVELPRPLKRRRIADSEESDLATVVLSEPTAHSTAREAKRPKTSGGPASTRVTQPEASPEGSCELGQGDEVTLSECAIDFGSAASHQSRQHPQLPTAPPSIVESSHQRPSTSPISPCGLSRSPTPAASIYGPRTIQRPPRRRESLDQLKPKPIRYHAWAKLLRTKAEFQRGTELGDLIDSLDTIKDGCGFLPRALKAELEPLFEEGPPRIVKWNLYDDPRPLRELQGELDDLLKVFRNQDPLTCESGYRPTWKKKVWSKILQWAVEVVPGVDWHSTTGVPIEDSLLPYVESPLPTWARRLERGSRTIRPPRAKHRMITKFLEHAVAIDPEPRAADAIRTIMLERQRKEQFTSINPIGDCELLERPIAIPIAATGYLNEYGQDCYMQLAYYASAWHKFMGDSEMARSLPLTSLRTPCIASLPMIEIRGAEWILYIAFDDVETGEIGMTRMDAPLGWTDCLYQTYKLLASLRVLLRWADGPYRGWWDAKLGVVSARPQRDEEP